MLHLNLTGCTQRNSKHTGHAESQPTTDMSTAIQHSTDSCFLQITASAQRRNSPLRGSSHVYEVLATEMFSAEAQPRGEFRGLKPTLA